MSKLSGKRSEANYSRTDRRHARYGKGTPGKPERYRTAAQNYNRAIRHNGKQASLSELYAVRDCDRSIYDEETACTGCRLCIYEAIEWHDDSFGQGEGEYDPDCCETLDDVAPDVRLLLHNQAVSWLSA